MADEITKLMLSVPGLIEWAEQHELQIKELRNRLNDQEQKIVVLEKIIDDLTPKTLQEKLSTSTKKSPDKPAGKPKLADKANVKA